MAFKVKVLNIDSVISKVEDIFKKDIRNSELFKEISDFTTLRVQAETRKGRDLTTGAVQKNLTPGTIGIRERVRSGKIKRIKKDGSPNQFWFEPDSVFFKPPFSNLTASGQLLASLKGRIEKDSGTIIVEPTGNRDRSLSNSTEFNTNKELAEDLAKRGRTFLGLDLTGIRRIKKMILDEVRRFKKSRGFK